MANIEKDIEPLVDPIFERSEQDGDAIYFCYFSREQDKYSGGWAGMDSGDALMVVDHLIKTFNLDREAISLMR